MSKKPKTQLDKYLVRDGEIVARTVRAPDKLWEKIEILAEKKEVSVNLLLVAIMEKACDEEGISL